MLERLFADADSVPRALINLHPVGRAGVPQDIGDALVFLVIVASALITDQVVVVDGRRTAKLPLPF